MGKPKFFQWAMRKNWIHVFITYIMVLVTVYRETDRERESERAIDEGWVWRESVWGTHLVEITAAQKPEALSFGHFISQYNFFLFLCFLISIFISWHESLIGRVIYLNKISILSWYDDMNDGEKKSNPFQNHGPSFANEFKPNTGGGRIDPNFQYIYWTIYLSTIIQNSSKIFDCNWPSRKS